MREACREERLFLAIGGVADALVEEAGAEAPRRQSPLMRWTAIAAAAAVVAAAGWASCLGWEAPPGIRVSSRTIRLPEEWPFCPMRGRCCR